MEVLFPNGNWFAKAVADPGYDIIGQSEMEFTTDDFTCRSEPTCGTCGSPQDEVRKAADDILVVDYSRGTCQICLVTWSAAPQEYWRYVNATHDFSVQVFTTEQNLRDAGFVKVSTKADAAAQNALGIKTYRLIKYPHAPLFKPMVVIDAIKWDGYDGQTYYFLDLLKTRQIKKDDGFETVKVAGDVWYFYSNPEDGTLYQTTYGWNTTINSVYTACTRTVGAYDITSGGVANRNFGNTAEADWRANLISHGVGGDASIVWSQKLWASPDGTLALPPEYQK